MTQEERLDAMLDILLAERPTAEELEAHKKRFQGLRYNAQDSLALPEKPWDLETKQKVWRGLVNIREPKPISSEYLALEEAYLKGRLADIETVSVNDLTPKAERLYLWQGDITHLAVDAIVNAANSDLLGCFIPNHACIDNQIHTFAGVPLRQEMAQIMAKQGRREPVGKAKISKAYALPAKYVIHTVGPTVTGDVNGIKESQLASSYRNSLKCATEAGLETLAFPCISTGEFAFPNERAAEIAVATVKKYLVKKDPQLKVIFNVFGDQDRVIYEKLLEQEG